MDARAATAALRSSGMSMRAISLLFLLCVAALQSTLLHLGASMVLVAFGGGQPLSWPALWLTALVAAWAVQRWEPVEASDAMVRRPTLLVCAVTVLYATKVQVGGGWSPLAGWTVLWPLGGASPNALVLFTGLLLSLWSWWRGMALPDYDHGDVAGTLQNGVLVLVLLAIVLTPLSTVNLGAPPWGALFAIEGATVIWLGLLALALARVATIGDDTPVSRWRLVRGSALAAIGLVGIGVLGLTLVSNAATAAVRGVIFVIAAAGALILSPLAEALYRLILLLGSLFGAEGDAVPSPSAVPLPSEPPAAPDGIDVRVFELLVSVLGALLYILPLLILVLLILLMQRRRRESTDETGALHESLWSWRSFAGDLRNVLSSMRPRRPGAGLREALLRLRGDDPARRIRRRYVEALLLGEAARQERMPQQTPLEYQPRLAEVAPGADAEVASLTDTYDRARYAPQSIQPADAATADAAWEAIRRSNKEAS